MHEPLDVLLTAERARELLTYSPIDGVLTWAQKRFNGAAAGQVAGTVMRDGYRMVKVDGRSYLAHRLVWLIVRGCWPSDMLDHRDGDRSNNRFANLREASNGTNKQNLRQAHRNNGTRLLGVSLDVRTGTYRARITADGRSWSLGYYPTGEAAHQAYLVAKRRLHAGCTI